MSPYTGCSAIGTAMEASSPRTKADEVKLLFKLFDADADGKVTVDEMKSVLQSLDAKLWTDERVDKVVTAYDESGDGALQFTEFWSWVCGHGGKSTDHFQPALLEKASEADRKRRAENQAKLDIFEKKREEREAKAAEAAAKLAEREHGERRARKDFIEATVGVGLSKEVAVGLYSQADEDRDGDVDQQEMLWVAADKAATTSQIRRLYQEAAGGPLDAKGNLEMKAVEDQGVQAIVEAFTAWDVNGNGTIEAEELGRVLSTLNPRLGMKTVEALCKEIDRDQNGTIDIMEFVDWLTGEAAKKKKMKKKAKEEQEAKLALAMHRKRAEEARNQDQQQLFEEAMHTFLKPWCEKKKIRNICGKLYTGPGAPQMCSSCGDRHGWLCHGCGFVNFTSDCMNGCDFSKHGWSCIDGNCRKKVCGCKKKPEYWMRAGRVHSFAVLSGDVFKIVEEADVRRSPVAKTKTGD